MGADQSQPPMELPIIFPQPERICATEPRFCLPHNVQLELKPKSSFSRDGVDYKIINAHDKSIIFRCKGQAFSLKKILRDDMGVPVLNRKSGIFR